MEDRFRDWDFVKGEIEIYEKHGLDVPRDLLWERTQLWVDLSRERYFKVLNGEETFAQAQERREERKRRKYMHPCLWIVDGVSLCRKLAESHQTYCKKHEQQRMDEMTEAVKHPEKWVPVERTINGKTYRNLVYHP